MENVFFISDLHFGHENALAFDNRPFENIEKHDAELIRRWNHAVGMDDDIYILGDFSFYGSMKTLEVLHSLNGVKHLIRGNHDSRFLKNRDVQAEFAEVTDYKEIKIGKNQGIVLCHYPIPCFRNKHRGWIHLYGHVHRSTDYQMMEHVRYQLEELQAQPCRMYNVGCMLPYMDYTPRTMEEILAACETTPPPEPTKGFWHMS